jgi:TRAP-type C4-dicarboxylate transport system permease small subunit
MSGAVMYVARLLLDCLIATAALALIVWAWRYARELAERQAVRVDLAADPVQAHVWDVLAEARRITERAATGGDDNATR